MRLHWIALSFLGAFTACSPAREPFPLRAVVAGEIAGLSSSVPAAPPPTTPKVAARALSVITHFVAMIDDSPSVYAEVHELGDEAVPFFESEFRDRGADMRYRVCVISVLTAVHSALSADALVRALAEPKEPELRARAALGLALSEQEHVVPALLEQLFVETDPSAARDMAFALCLLGNYGGVARLSAVQASDRQSKGYLEDALAHAKEVNPSAQ